MRPVIRSLGHPETRRTIALIGGLRIGKTLALDSMLRDALARGTGVTRINRDGTVEHIPHDKVFLP